MLDKFIKLNEKKIIAGQTSGGKWYCKELPADNTEELQILIGEINRILNIYNAEKTEKKEGKK